MLSGLVLVVAALPAADPQLLAQEARRIHVADPCAAMHLYLLAYAESPEAKFLFNAAEVAYAAVDRQQAQRLYGQVASAHPDFKLKDVVAQRRVRLERELKGFGAGKRCGAKVARCGDAALDRGERCDDGNDDAGDGCSARCSPEAVPVPEPAPLPPAPAAPEPEGDQPTATEVHDDVPPEPPPLAEQPPSLQAFGIGGLALGGAVTIGSLVPLIAYLSESGAIEAQRAAFLAAGNDADRAAALDEGAAAQARLEGWRGTWNSVGVLGVCAGAALVGVGTALLLIGAPP